MGLVFLLVRAFAARLETRTPVKVALFAFLLNVALNLLLVGTPLRHAGLALASSIAFTVHAVVLHVILNGKLAREGAPVRARRILAASGKVAVASAALVLVFWPLDRWLGIRFAESIMLGRVLRVVVAGGAGAAVYLLVSAALGLPEVRDLFIRSPRGRPS